MSRLYIPLYDTANGGPLSGFSELLRGGVSSTITGVMPPLSVVMFRAPDA